MSCFTFAKEAFKTFGTYGGAETATRERADLTGMTQTPISEGDAADENCPRRKEEVQGVCTRANSGSKNGGNNDHPEECSTSHNFSTSGDGSSVQCFVGE